MDKIQYVVTDEEGTLIDRVWEAPEHVGGAADAIATVSREQGISKEYLRARAVIMS